MRKDNQDPEAKQRKGKTGQETRVNRNPVPRLRRPQFSMKTKLIVTIIILTGLIILACGTGMSRLGRTNMTRSATKIAERYLNQLASLSRDSRDTADRIASETVQRIDLSPYLTDVEKAIGLFRSAILQEMHSQVRYALAERKAQWKTSKVRLLQGYTCRVTAHASIHVNVHMSASTGDFDREWTLHIELELEVEADQGKIISWAVGNNTYLEPWQSG